MFLLGIAGGTLCVSYAVWRNSPYHELTKALAAEFPQSVPKVEGGRHQDSPMTLRIVVNVEFNPADEQYEPDANAAIGRVVELVQQHQDLTPYEIIRIHLVKKRPQDTLSRKSVDMRVEELLESRSTSVE